LKKVTKRYKKVLFRADSSSQIGLGHIMRDLVLAKQFKDDEVIFACRDLDGHIMDKIPYPIKVLSTDSIDELIDVINHESIDMVVIDNYEISYEDEKKIKDKTGVKIFVLDDTYERHHCDVLLNHNISADESRYKELVPKECELRCGSKYTLLRDEFKKVKKEKTIFLAMGGADHSHINIKILKVLKKFKNIKVHLVTTTSNANLEELTSYVKKRKWIKLHVNSKKVAKLMKKSDFAIVTPSVTVNEVSFMGLPFIAIKTADNQKDIYEYLKENGFLVIEKFDKKILSKLVDSFSFELIDFTNLSLKERDMVLLWRNHENVRKWMLDKNLISQQQHVNFIKNLKSLTDRVYFLVKKDDIAIGVIDFTKIDEKNKTASFGIYTNPNLRGKGMMLMDTVLDYSYRILKLKTLKAEVFKDNILAIKLYEKYQFTKLKEENDLIYMELKDENRKI